jgi:hypothetical protein
LSRGYINKTITTLDSIYRPVWRKVLSSFVYLAQLSRFHSKTETESGLQNVVLYIKDRSMDNVQNCDGYNVPKLEKKYQVSYGPSEGRQ